MSRVRYSGQRGAGADQVRADRQETELDIAFRTTAAELDGWGVWNVVRASSAYSASPQDLILLNASGGGFVVLLPDPTTCIGKCIQWKEFAGSANTVTFKVPNGWTIEGAASYAASTPRGRGYFRAFNDGWVLF